MVCFNPSGAETGALWANYWVGHYHTMVADALAPDVATLSLRPSDAYMRQ